jgi:hypothetical protein
MIYEFGFAFPRTVIRSCTWDKHHDGKCQSEQGSGELTLDFPMHDASKNKNGHRQI